VRRSLDAGRSWSSATTLSRTGDWPSDVEVAGSDVYVAFTDPAGPARNPWSDSRATYRRSFDGGVTWSDKLSLSPELHHRSLGAQLVLSPDGVGAIYTACRDAECRTGVFYRQSADGRHWTVPEMVGPASGYSDAWGIAYSGSVLVAYTVEPPDTEYSGYSLWGYVRKAEPQP
jgi:hypothetical protein